MVGISRHTGQRIERPLHIRQSIETILNTAVGTRVMRCSFGFDVLNDDGKPKPGLTHEIVEKSTRTALTEFEPRIDIESVSSAFGDGRLRQIAISYRDRESGEKYRVGITY